MQHCILCTWNAARVNIVRFVIALGRVALEGGLGDSGIAADPLVNSVLNLIMTGNEASIHGRIPA